MFFKKLKWRLTIELPPLWQPYGVAAGNFKSPHGVAANTFSLGVTTPPLITLSFSFPFLIYFKDFF
jgi:hypothetical protein